MDFRTRLIGQNVRLLFCKTKKTMFIITSIILSLSILNTTSVAIISFPNLVNIFLNT